jgi:hypothetical protein
MVYGVLSAQYKGSAGLKLRVNMIKRQIPKKTRIFSRGRLLSMRRIGRKLTDHE